MFHASPTHRPTIQSISHAYAVILTFLAISIFTIITEHVPAVENDNADALSCPSQFPTWSLDSVVSLELILLMIFRVSVGLLLHLHWLVSGPQTRHQLESASICS